VKAVSCRAPGSIALVDVDPPELRPGWVQLDVRHIGICGTDYHIYEGSHPYLRYPRIIGHELSGVVANANGSAFTVGDPVVVNPYLSCCHCPACAEGKPNCCETLQVLGVHVDGGMTESIVVPAGNLYPATGLSLRDAAMTEFLAIGAHAVRRSELAAGMRALVVGAGPIGLGVACFARLAGADVTVIDAAPDKVETAAALGVRALPLTALEAPDFATARRSGFDVVLDATGAIAAMNASWRHVRNGGAYTLVGVIDADLVWPDSEVHRRELTIRASRNATRADFDRVMHSVRTGAVPTDRLATHATTLDAVVADLPRWAEARTGLVKAIVSV
jgi:2-desacetyl-2-hydroxyethyl bacteriochlorophyllide A dehydrogenase